MEAMLGTATCLAGAPGLDKILQATIQEAFDLFKLYRNRGGDRKSFALFMNNVAKTLEGVKATVPPHAEPVARELAALVAAARAKVSKYEARGFTSGVLHLRSEAEKLQSIMRGVQQLLPLLTVSVASAGNVSEAVSDLQRRADSLQDSSAEAAAHLSHVASAVEALSASSASAAQVEQCLAALHGSMMNLHERSIASVLEGCSALQEQLAHGIDSLLEAVDTMQMSFESFSKQMLALQRDMRADVKEIKGYLSQFCGLGSGDLDADSMPQGRILAAIDEVIEDGGEPPDSNEKWAAALRGAILEGKLSITSCLVLGVPLMPEGPLRPVALPCCGFVVSHAGGQRLKEQGKCHICKGPIAAHAELQESGSVAAAVSAENRGFALRVVQSSEVTIDTSAKIHLGSGGEGTVVKGTFRGRAVAVKQIPVPAAVGVKEMASVKHVVSTSYIAGVASPYVCKLFGYCWTDSHLWLLLELCEGSLTELVPRAKELCDLPGLPPVDTVALGLMLCSALDAVHCSARCLHLDLTPGNVLLAASAGKVDREAGHGPRSVRLSDFGLSKHLPSCVATTLATAAPQSKVNGVAMGTPGYAPKEQLQGSAQRRSDVYSLGATLLYAATGVHPFQGGTLQSIMFNLLTGRRIPVPDSVKPAALKGLLTDMTAIEPSSRPTLSQVQKCLAQIHTALRADGAAERFIAPVDPDSTLVPGGGFLKQLNNPVRAGGVSAADERGLSWTPGRVHVSERSDSSGDGAESVASLSQAPSGDQLTTVTLLFKLSMPAPSDHGALCQTLHKLVSALMLHLRSCVLEILGELARQDGQGTHARSVCLWFKHIRSSQFWGRSPVEPPQAEAGSHHGGALSELLKMLGDAEGEAGDAGQSQGTFSSTAEFRAIANGNDGGVCKHVQEEPPPAVVQRLGYGAILLGKANARLNSPAFTLTSILTSMGTSAAICARALECLRVLHFSSAAIGDGARSLLITISLKLFLYWADFANGMMQLLQGAINVAAALRCSVSSDFLATTDERFSDPITTCSNVNVKLRSGSPKVSANPQGILVGATQDASARLDVISSQIPGTGLDHRESSSSPITEPHEEHVDDSQAGAPPESNVQNLKAVFIPNMLIKLGMEQIRLLVAANGGHHGGDESSGMFDALKLFVQANVLRLNWANAAASGLWKSMPVRKHEDVQQRRTVGKCPETDKFYRPEGPQLPLARLCCGEIATSEEGLHLAAAVNANGEIPCKCGRQMQALQIEECDVCETEFDAACMADSTELQSFLPATPNNRQDTSLADYEGLVVHADARAASGGPLMLAAFASELGRDIFWESPKVASFVERLPLRGVPVEPEGTGVGEFLRLHDLDGLLGLPDSLAAATPTGCLTAILSKAEQDRLRHVCAGEHAGALNPEVAALVQEACTLATGIPGPADQFKGSSDVGTSREAALDSLQLQSAPDSSKGPAEGPSPGRGGRNYKAAGAAAARGTARGTAAAWRGKPPGAAAHISPDPRTDASRGSHAAQGAGKYADVSSIRTIEQLCARIEAAPEALTYDFHGGTLRPASALQAASGASNPPEAKHVCPTQGRGTVTNVCVDLSHPGAEFRGVWLWLGGTSQVEFRDVTVKGGTLLCSGPQCHVVLSNVDLRSCLLGAHNGATVSADGGRWEMQEGSRSAARVLDGCWNVCIVQGAGTTVSASRTTFDGRILVHEGASFTAEAAQVRLQSCLDGEVGVLACDSGTRVTLRDAAVVYHGSRPEEEVRQAGVSVHDRAVLDMAGGSVQQADLGVAVGGGGHVRMRDCTVDAAWDGVCVYGADTRVHAVGCRISGGAASVATTTDVAKSNIAFEKCEVGKWRTYGDVTNS